MCVPFSLAFYQIYSNSLIISGNGNCCAITGFITTAPEIPVMKEPMRDQRLQLYEGKTGLDVFLFPEKISGQNRLIGAFFNPLLVISLK
jgi:hypothetical protein